MNEPCNLIGREAQLAIPNQKQSSQILPSLDRYLHAKTQIYQLISSRVIDDQWILWSNWTTGTTGHSQPKVLASDDTFIWWLTPCKRKLRYPLSLSRDINNRRILQFDWTSWPHPTKTSSLISYLFLMIIFMQKIKGMDRFFLKMRTFLKSSATSIFAV